MATILRSSKYIRCLNVIARRIVVANDNRTLVKKNLELHARCASSYLTKRSYATIPAIERNETLPNFDKTFEKFDRHIQRFGRIFKHELDLLLDQVRESGYLSPFDALLLVRCCGNLLVDITPEKRNKLVDEIWQTMEVLRVPLDISHFNALLRVYLENNYEFSPIEFLTTMRNKRVEPNRITYKRLMLHYCKKGDIDGASKILEVMKDKGLPLDEGVFDALLTGHSEANDMESAEKVIGMMRKAGVEPRSSTYVALLNAYAKRGDIDSIRTTLEEIVTKDLYIQDSDYFDIIYTLAMNGHDEHVDEIFNLITKGPHYNIEGVNAMLRILDIGKIDIAMKILASMEDRKHYETGSDNGRITNSVILIKKLVNANFSPDEITKVCRELQNAGECQQAFFTALELTLTNADIKTSLALMEAWKDNGGEIREHYFRPMFIAYGKSGNHEATFAIIDLMRDKYNLSPSPDTIQDYILPYMSSQFDEIASPLERKGVPRDDINIAQACRLLRDHKISKAAAYMLTHPAKYNPEYFYRPIAEAVRATGDAGSYAFILRFLCEDSAEGGKTESSTQLVDTAMRALFAVNSNLKCALLEKILGKMVEQGLSMSPSTAKEISMLEMVEGNTSIATSLEELTSGTLAHAPLPDKLPSLDGGDSKFEDSDYRMRESFSTKRQALSIALQRKDVETAKHLIQELEASNFTFTIALCAELIHAFCQIGDLENAEKWLIKCKTQYPNMVLDVHKVVELADCYIKHGRVDDAVQCIRHFRRTEVPFRFEVGPRILVKKLLDTIAETGNVEKTEEIFEALLESNYLEVNNSMLGPLVRVHLVRDDLESALAALESACEKYRCTPLKNELAKRFIEAEDAVSLQRLTDLSTQIHGENNSLIDLVLAFVESKRLRQARKILETSELKLRGSKLENIVERYANEGTNNHLEVFADITKGLPIFDRREFYEVLMNCYAKKNSWQRGLSIWTTMQEEELRPSNNCLRTLANLLTANNQPVPFTCYNVTESHPDESNKPLLQDDAVVKFTEAMESKDFDEAERVFASIPLGHPELTTLASKLIVGLVEEKKDSMKAMEILENMVTEKEKEPRAYAIKAVWNDFANAGLHDELIRHGSHLTPNLKRKLRFAKFLTRAKLQKFGLEKCLSELEEKLKGSRADNFRIVEESLHFSSLIKEFEKNPSAISKFQGLAEDLARQQIFLPVNVLWAYHFTHEQPEADELWSKYFAGSGRVMFQNIVLRARRNNDLKLLTRLWEKVLTNNQLADSAKVSVLSSLIDLCTEQKHVDEAFEILKESPPSAVKLWQKLYPISAAEFEKLARAIGKTISHATNKTGQDQQVAAV